jgi:glycosyltransferase involved in cell wall biosynthesis
MSEKIAVLHLRHSSGGGGGADTVIINTALFLNPSRFSMIVVFLRKYSDNLIPVIERLKRSGVNYFDFPGSMLFDIRQFMNIANLIKRQNVRILHCHDPKTDFYGYLLKSIFPKLQLVSTIHGWIARRLRSLLYLKVDRLALKKCDAVIAVSEDIRQSAEKYGIWRPILVKNGIDLNAWVPGRGKGLSDFSNQQAGSFKIGFVGRISREKGPFDFVKAANLILAENPDCEFLIAGRGPEEDEMKALVNHLGLENKFRFLGHLNEQGLYDLYQNLNLLLLTSHTEGLPMAVLEACAMHVPVVAADVGGVGEVIKHKINGLLFKPGDISAIVKNVLFIINNRDVADAFRQNARNTVEEDFSFEKTAKKIEDIYSTLLTGTIP